MRAGPGPDLSSGCHLAQQVLHHHVGQHPQQHVAGLGVPVQPALGLGLGGGAAAFDHVGHQRPLVRGEETCRKQVSQGECVCRWVGVRVSRTHRGTGEPDERHFAFYSVAGERDGLEDVAQLLVHVHFGAQALQVLRLLQGLWECGTFARHHLDLHTHGLKERVQNGSLY